MPGDTVASASCKAGSPSSSAARSSPEPPRIARSSAVGRRRLCPEPHAEALKSKLAESRVVAEDREEFESAETPIDQAETVPSEVGDRRRSVHERGREVAEQMRRGNSSAN